MDKLGAASVTAIEADPRAFLRCLCVKEVLGLRRVSFKLGSFLPYLDACPPFDVINASGVPYHMTDPLALLDRINSRTDRLMVWSRYYDPAVSAGRDDRELFAPPEPSNGTSYRGSKRLYPGAALSWKGFPGGADSYATWLERDSLMAYVAGRGCRTSIAFDHLDHPNGPAIAICAKRQSVADG